METGDRSSKMECHRVIQRRKTVKQETTSKTGHISNIPRLSLLNSTDKTKKKVVQSYEKLVLHILRVSQNMVDNNNVNCCFRVPKYKHNTINLNFVPQHADNKRRQTQWLACSFV